MRPSSVALRQNHIRTIRYRRLVFLLRIDVRPIVYYRLSIVLALHRMVQRRIRRSDKPWRRIRYCPLSSPHDPLRSRHIRKPWRSVLAIVFTGNCQYPRWNNKEVSRGTAWVLECRRGERMFLYDPLYYIYRTVVLFLVLSNLLLLS